MKDRVLFVVKSVLLGVLLTIVYCLCWVILPFALIIEQLRRVKIQYWFLAALVIYGSIPWWNA